MIYTVIYIYQDLYESNQISKEDIDYKNLLEDSPHYSVGIFFMPKGSILPFHDHINLLVFSKIISGELLFFSYDKVDTNDENM